MGFKKTTDGNPKVKFLELFRYATPLDKCLMVFGLICSAASGAAFPLTTVIFGDLVNIFTRFEARAYIPNPPTPEQLVNEVSASTIYFIYLAIGTFITTYLYMALFIHTGERITFKIRQEYLKAVLRQNMSWYDEEGAGSVTTRITTDTLLIQDGISDKIPLCLSHICTTLSGFAIAFSKSWILSLVLLSIFPLIAGSAVFMNLVNAKFQRRILGVYSDAGSFAEETLACIRTVVAFNGQAKMSKRYKEKLVAARKEGLKKSMATGVGIGLLFFIIYCGYSLAFYYGSRLLLKGEITPGQVTNVFFAILIGAFSIGQVAPDLQAFAFAMGAAVKIYNTIDRIPEIDSETNGKTLPELRGTVEFKNVVFHYPSRPEVPILKSINFSVEKGHTVALVGASGSGKSTIIQLLERFYDPIDGDILVDNVPLKDFQLKWIRRQIGLVSQEPVLFEGSIYDNVAHGLVGSSKEQVSEKEKRELVRNACTMANAHEFIMQLTDQYDTQVGERGMLLSGGQKQRVAIARAIIKNPSILLLDEATSALDTHSERIVQEALDKAAQGRTTIVIAHRLSTIKNVDKIIVMSKGEIVEQGSHSELLKIPNGYYKLLVDAQQLAKEEQTQPTKTEVIKVAPEKSVQESIRINSHASILAAEEGEQRKFSSFYVMRRIVALNRKEWAFLLPGLIAALASGMVYPFFAIIFANMIQVFTKTGSELDNGAIFWSIMFVVIAIVTFFANFAMNTLFGHASEYLTERIRSLVFTNFLNQDVAFFDQEQHTTGALTANLSADAQKIQGISGVTIGSLLTVLTNLVGGAIVALIFGWKLGLTAIACLPVLVFSGFFRIYIITYFAEKAKGAYEKSAQLACEAVAAIRTIQSLTRESNVFDLYYKILLKPHHDGIKSAYYNTTMYAFSQCVNFLVNALVFWYGGNLIAYEGYTVSQMFTVFIAVVFGSMGAGRIFAYSPDMQKAKEAGENIINLLDSSPTIDAHSDSGKKVESIQGTIEFKDILFRYPTRPHISVLNHVSLIIKPGQFVALVGASGSGKSTSVGLIERFYDVVGGNIFIDGMDIRSYNISSLRNHIGLVSQEPNLFDMSIKENILFGCETMPSMEVIEQAAKDANIHEFIMSLPEQYNTRVGAKGSQLSGGQKQRIAIARALIRNPKILLLDEATSALDAESEKVVQQALDKATKGRTTVAIAHRLSTIQHADMIYVFKQGNIVEQGDHQSLLHQRGVYYELAQEQSLAH